MIKETQKEETVDLYETFTVEEVEEKLDLAPLYSGLSGRTA